MYYNTDPLQIKENSRKSKEKIHRTKIRYRLNLRPNWRTTICLMFDRVLKKGGIN